MTPTSNLPPGKLEGQKSSIVFNSSLKRTSSKKELQVRETELGYHYEMKIPGYVKEDFRFYISRNDLVITTEKSKASKTKGDSVKHSYCYPSALFKMKIPLPKQPVKKEITVEYKNEILCFDLFKLD